MQKVPEKPLAAGIREETWRKASQRVPKGVRGGTHRPRAARWAEAREAGGGVAGGSRGAAAGGAAEGAAGGPCPQPLSPQQPSASIVLLPALRYSRGAAWPLAAPSPRRPQPEPSPLAPSRSPLPPQPPAAPLTALRAEAHKAAALPPPAEQRGPGPPRPAPARPPPLRAPPSPPASLPAPPRPPCPWGAAGLRAGSTGALPRGTACPGTPGSPEVGGCFPLPPQPPPRFGAPHAPRTSCFVPAAKIVPSRFLSGWGSPRPGQSSPAPCARLREVVKGHFSLPETAFGVILGPLSNSGLVTSVP